MSHNALRQTASYMLWRRNSARVAQCVTIGVVPPVVRISGTVIRAGFKPIWPISSNRAPRQRGPALRLQPTQTYTFYRSCLCIVQARGTVFLSCFERQKWLSNFSNGFTKYSINSLYYYHQSTPKPWLTNISVFRWNSYGFWKSLCSQELKGKT